MTPAPPLRLREPVNGLMHLAGLVLAALGLGLLAWRCRADALHVLAVAIYGAAMCGCFLASSLHHLIAAERAVELRLLRLDHAAIYPFIAGTYTPVCLLMLPGKAGWAMLAAAWGLAAVGVVHKLVFASDPETIEEPPTVAGSLLYGVMGWLAVFQLGELLRVSAPGTIPLLVLGGLAYTLGGVILTQRLLDWRPGRLGHHEIWHVCVLAGAALHYAYIYLNVAR